MFSNPSLFFLSSNLLQKPKEPAPSVPPKKPGLASVFNEDDDVNIHAPSLCISLYIFITWLITCFPAERTWGDASRSKDANEKHWQVNTYFHTVQLLLSEFLVTRLLISYRTGRRQHLQDRIRLTKASKVSLTIRSSGRGSWRPKEKIHKMSEFLSVAAMTAQVFVSVNPVLETSLHMSTWVEEWL